MKTSGSHLRVINLHEKLTYADLCEDVMRLTVNVSYVGIRRYFQFHRPYVNLGAESPEVGLMEAQNTFQLHNSLVTDRQRLLNLFRRSLHQNRGRVI